MSSSSPSAFSARVLIVGLVVWVVVSFVPALGGAFVGMGEWYRSLENAGVATAGLGVRSGVDRALFDARRRGMAGLAARWAAGAAPGTRSVRGAVGVERALDTAVLRAAATGFGGWLTSRCCGSPRW